MAPGVFGALEALDALGLGFFCVEHRFSEPPSGLRPPLHR
jgi:hypothetical protein